jgi:hypothetical protein
MYELGPTAAGEGCRGEVPRLGLDIPPTGASGSLSLTYPPTAVQRGARAGGLLGGFPNPAKLILYAFRKKWARRLAATKVAPEPPKRGGAVPAKRPAAAEPASRSRSGFCSRPGAALPAPFSYAHRPPFSGARGPAGSWADFPIPQNSLCMRFAKNGLAGSQPRCARAVVEWGPKEDFLTRLPCTIRPTLYLTYPVLFDLSRTF